ncbi:PREDICTED: uncharacterized protein LOC109174740 [Ipomoea nil]|uniref:uncharacterized protein LOC109174740 n=1 Tax=Ipomoea nil TaxID=35883 RepID=UPI0009009235|nr:PREDICTED: uncharacterized protein LOC109174740 [Ipomoea nil]
MADWMSSCIGEFVADIDMAMAAEQLMQLSGEDDGAAADESINGTTSTAGDNKKRKKRSEKVAMRERNEDEDDEVVMAPRRVRKYRSLHNLYMLTKPITNLHQ